MSDETRPKPALSPTPDANQRTDSSKLDELLERESAVPAVAVSPTDRSSDRIQSDADQAATVERLDQLTASNPDRTQSDADQAANIERNTADRKQSDADQVVTVEMMTRMLGASSALATSASVMTDLVRVDHELAVEERKEAKRARRRFTLLAFGAALAVLALLVPVLLLLISANNQRRESQDCIIPTGQCFKDSQVRTAGAIENVNQVAILAAACAPDYVRLPLPQRIAAIRKCVLAGEQAAARAKAKAKPKLPPPTTKPTLPRSAPRSGSRPQLSGTLSRPLTGVRQPGRATAARNGSRPSAGSSAPPRRTTAPRPSTAPAPSTPPLILCTRLPVVGSICI